MTGPYYYQLKFGETSILKALTHIFTDGRHPEKYQILWCDTNCTSQSLKAFFRRAKQFPFIPFALIGINLLKPVVQQDCLSYLVEAKRRSRTSEEARNLFFLDLEFSVIKSVAWMAIVGDEDLVSTDFQTQLDVWCYNLNRIESIECYCGSSGMGKSYQIKKRLMTANETTTLNLSITEGFSRSEFVKNVYDKLLESAGSSILLAFQFNIGRFKAKNISKWNKLKDEINQFFCDFFLFQSLEDTSSGILSKIPVNSGLKILIEIPDKVGNFDDSNKETATTTSAELIDEFPLLKAVGKIHNVESFPFDVNPEANHVAKYLKAHESGSIDQLYLCNADVYKDVVFVIDNSGSMDGERLETCKRCLLNDILPSKVNKDDLVGLLVFNSCIQTNIPMEVYNSDHQKRIVNAVSSLVATGGTEMWSCLEVAVDTLAKSSFDHSKWLVALTDGASGGSPQRLRGLLRGVGKDINVLFITIGLESGYEKNIRDTCIRSDKDLLLSITTDLKAITDAWKVVGDRLTVSQKIEKDGESLTNYECVILLRKYMQLDRIHSDWSRLKQKQWIRYMYRRCGILASSEKFNKNQSFPKFGSTTMHVMLEEADLALSENLRIDWQSQNHEQLVYSKTLSIDKDGNEAFDYKWSIIATNPDDTTDRGWKQRVKLLKSLKMQIPTKEDINRPDRRVLDSYLAHGLEIKLSNAQVERSTRGEVFDFEIGTLPIINDKKFVLTLEFVIKLLSINERIESGVPCIMEGETGVSKTAITRMLFILKNCEHTNRKKSAFFGIISSGLHTDLESVTDGNGGKLGAYRKLADYFGLSYLAEKDVWGNLEELSKTICQEKCDLVVDNLLHELKSDPELDPLVNFGITESSINQRVGLFGKEKSYKLLDWYVNHVFTQQERVGSKDEHWTFFTIDVHAALTPEYIGTIVQEVVDRATRLQRLGNLLKSQIHKRIKICIFFDEVNTSPYMGLFKELIIDHSLNGVSLPPNVITIAACNPCREKIQISGDRREELGNEWAMGHYQVHPLPKSMRQMTWAYGSMSSSQEFEFIFKKLQFMKDTENVATEEINLLAMLLLYAQTVTREFAELHIKAILEEKNLTADDEEIAARASASVSLRDILRVFELFAFFRDTNHPEIVLNVFLGDGYDSDNASNLRFRSMMLAIAIVYYLRLGSDSYNENNDYRTKFRNKIRNKFGNSMDIQVMLESCTASLMEHVLLDRGVANTKGLQENIVMIIVCCLSKCPLMIIGPPGSSKTLAVTIVADNARGEYSKTDFFKAIPTLLPFRYQCSRRSTSLEIEAVFKRAIDRQNKANIEKSNIICFVFMDEAGLPEDGRESLKVLHYYLENHNKVSARVSFIAISNHLLDAAKSNRCVLLSRAKPDITELMNVARGCFGNELERRRFISTVHGYHSDGVIQRLELDPLDPNKAGVLRLLSETYDSCMSEQKRIRAIPGDTLPPKDFVIFFGLRDFMHFVKLLHRLAVSNKHQVTRSIIVEALSRNFNGVDFLQLRELIEYFMMPFPHTEPSSEGLVLRNPFYLLKDSLNECTTGSGPVNRYKMIIDTTMDDSIIRALKYALISLCGKHSAANSTILKLSNFPEESLHEQIKFVSQVKWMAEKGRLALLSQIASVNECFYDLFNQNFRRFVDVTENGTSTVYHADIAVGAHSRRCRILEEFVCIVHITLAELQIAPAPYLNRFEKYRITHVHLLDAAVHGNPLVQNIQALSKVLSSSRFLEHIYSFVHSIGVTTIFGFGEEQSIESCLAKTILSWDSVDKIIEAINVLSRKLCYCEALQQELNQLQQTFDCSHLRRHAYIQNLLESPQSEEDLHIGMAIVGQALVHIIVFENLMKVSITEQLLYHASAIPKSMLNELISDNSRFSLIGFLDNLQTVKKRKNILFTKTSSDLIAETTNDAEQLTDGGVFVIDTFSQFLRESSFIDKISNFYTEGNHTDTYVLVIDGSTTPSSQINYVRHKFDEVIGSLDNSYKSVVLLVHFAPSDILLRAHYQTTFSDDWNTVFLEGINDSAVPSWIQFGFEIDGLEQEQALNFPAVLKEWLPDALDQVVASISVSAKHISWMEEHALQGVISQSAIMNFLIPILFSNVNGIKPIDIIIQNFIKTWSDETGELSLLKEFIQQKVRDIASGECQLSLQNAIVVGIKSALVKFLLHYASRIIEDTSNVLIAELANNNDSANCANENQLFLAEFWITHFKALLTPRLSELITPLKPVHICCSKLVPKWIEKFPFFLSLANRIHNCTVYTLGIYANYEENDVWEKVAMETYNQLLLKSENDESLLNTVKSMLFTDDLPSFVWERYLQNFVFYFFQDNTNSGIQSLQFQLIYRWFDTHPAIAQSYNKICTLHAVAYWYRDTLDQLIQLLYPINSFREVPVDNLSDLVDELTSDSKKINSWIIHSVFEKMKVVILQKKTATIAQEVQEFLAVTQQFSLVDIMQMYCEKNFMDPIALKEIQSIKAIELVLLNSSEEFNNTKVIKSIVKELCVTVENRNSLLIDYSKLIASIFPVKFPRKDSDGNTMLSLLHQWNFVVKILHDGKYLNSCIKESQAKELVNCYANYKCLSIHQRSSILMHLLFWDASNFRMSQMKFINSQSKSIIVVVKEANHLVLESLESFVWRNDEDSMKEYIPYWLNNTQDSGSSMYLLDGIFAVIFNFTVRFHGTDSFVELCELARLLRNTHTSGLSTVMSFVTLSAVYVLLIDWMSTTLVNQYFQSKKRKNSEDSSPLDGVEGWINIFDPIFTESSRAEAWLSELILSVYSKIKRCKTSKDQQQKTVDVLTHFCNENEHNSKIFAGWMATAVRLCTNPSKLQTLVSNAQFRLKDICISGKILISFDDVSHDLILYNRRMSAQASEYSFIKVFIQRRKKLRLLWVLPDLIEFYTWLSGQLSTHDIPKDKFIDLTIQTILDNLAHTENGQENLQLWIRVKVGIKQFVEEFSALQLVAVDESTPIIDVLSLSRSDVVDNNQFGDLLFTLIREMIDYYNDFLTYLDKTGLQTYEVGNNPVMQKKRALEDFTGVQSIQIQQLLPIDASASIEISTEKLDEAIRNHFDMLEFYSPLSDSLTSRIQFTPVSTSGNNITFAKLQFDLHNFGSFEAQVKQTLTLFSDPKYYQKMCRFGKLRTRNDQSIDGIVKMYLPIYHSQELINLQKLMELVDFILEYIKIKSTSIEESSSEVNYSDIEEILKEIYSDVRSHMIANCFQNDDQLVTFLNLHLDELLDFRLFLDHMMETESYLFAHKKFELKLQWPEVVENELCTFLHQNSSELLGKINNLEFNLAKYEQRISISPEKSLIECLRTAFMSDKQIFEQVPLLESLSTIENVVSTIVPTLNFSFTGQFYVTLRVKLRTWLKKFARNTQREMTTWNWSFLNEHNKSHSVLNTGYSSKWRSRTTPWFLKNTELAAEEERKAEMIKAFRVKNATRKILDLVTRFITSKRLKREEEFSALKLAESIGWGNESSTGGRGRGRGGRGGRVGRGGLGSRAGQLVTKPNKEDSSRNFISLGQALKKSLIEKESVENRRSEALANLELLLNSPSNIYSLALNLQTGIQTAKELDVGDHVLVVSAIQRHKDLTQAREKAMSKLAKLLASKIFDSKSTKKAINLAVNVGCDSSANVIVDSKIKLEKYKELKRMIDHICADTSLPSLDYLLELQIELEENFLDLKKTLAETISKRQEEELYFNSKCTTYFGASTNCCITSSIKAWSADGRIKSIDISIPPASTSANDFTTALEIVTLLKYDDNVSSMRNNVSKALDLLDQSKFENWIHRSIYQAVSSTAYTHLDLYREDAVDDVQTYCSLITAGDVSEIVPVFLLVASRLYAVDMKYQVSCLRRCVDFVEVRSMMTKAELKAAEYPFMNAVLSSSPNIDNKEESYKQKWIKLKSSSNAIQSAAIDEIIDFVGMDSVKNKVLKVYNTLMKEASMPSDKVHPRPHNFFLLGNPGTGKTTIAKLLGKMYGELGIRKEGLFVQTSGEELLRMGSMKAAQLIDSVKSGVIFIDEAHKLDPKSNRAEGEAIASQLLRLTDEGKLETSVILAGYKNDIDEKLIDYDDGFRSRFENSVITFEDYTEEELADIFRKKCLEKQWSPENDDVVTIAAKRIARGRGRRGFGNARMVEKLVELAYERALERENTDYVIKIVDVIGPRPDRTQQPELNSALEELEGLIGLAKVKKAILDLVELALTNYDRELRGDSPLPVALNRVFLGNPGTGKTSVAKLYGRVLKCLGFLSKSGWELLKPSDFIGDAVGVTQTKTAKLLKKCEGKIMIIDEAYSLINSSYGSDAIDEIVATISGAPGEDICCVMIGYEKEMKKMFRSSNPGLTGRFDLINAFVFEDFSEHELETILMSELKKCKLFVSRLVRKKVVASISQQRYLPNFRNAGVVVNTVSHAKTALSVRDPNTTQLTLEDFKIEDINSAENDWRAMLANMSKVEHIVAHFEKLEATLKQIAKDKGNPRKHLKNYVFSGSPGTGKTEMANIISKMLQDLNLANSTLVKCSALELQGQYIGQTKDKVNELVDSAVGGILFIDEAYTLANSYKGYAQEACDQLVARTEPSDMKKPVVILAGYKRQMDELFSQVNPGLRSRFTEEIEFPDWDANDCLVFLQKQCKKDGFQLSDETASVLFDSINDLIKRSSWSNARDCWTIYNELYAVRAMRVNNVDELVRSYVVDDVKTVIQQFQKMRPYRSVDRESTEEISELRAEAVDASSDVQSIRRKIDKRKQTSSKEKEAEPNINNGTDSPEFMALLLACREAGYDSSHERRQLLVKLIDGVLNLGNSFPDDIMNIVIQKTGKTEPQLMPILKPQVPILLEGMQLAVAAEELRLKELQRIKDKEERRLKEIKQQVRAEKLRRMGRCVAGFSWHRHVNGWKCAGGSHFCSDTELDSYDHTGSDSSRHPIAPSPTAFVCMVDTRSTSVATPVSSEWVVLDKAPEQYSPDLEQTAKRTKHRSLPADSVVVPVRICQPKRKPGPGTTESTSDSPLSEDGSDTSLVVLGKHNKPSRKKQNKKPRTSTQEN